MSRDLLSLESVTHVTDSLALGVLGAVVYVGPFVSWLSCLGPFISGFSLGYGFCVSWFSMQQATLPGQRNCP